MKYFFNFETYGRSGKVDNKEMFYLRLLKKRMKDNYEIFRKPHPMNAHIHRNHIDNMFNGNIIEFHDKKTFSKFKLDYSGLLNPKISEWKNHIHRITSFETDDDFVEKANSLYKKYNEAERIMVKKCDIERMCQNHNSYRSSFLRSMEEARDNMNIICGTTVEDFIDENDIASFNNISKNVSEIIGIISQTPTITLPNCANYYYEHPDITKINIKYDTLYKQLYSNVQSHDIP